MDEGVLNDLKQFIAATVSQATAGLATNDSLQRLGQDLSTKIDDLELKVDTISDALNDHLDDHEIRLAKLEQQTA